MNGGSTSKVAAVVIAIVLSALAVFMLVTAYTYSRSSGIFPIFVGWIFVALALLESVVQLRTLIGRGATAPAASEEPAAPGGEAASLREIGGFLWLGLFLTLIYFAGFVIATPIFIVAFLRLSAGRSFVHSVSFALAAAAVVYVVFVFLLDYQLYRGTLLGA
ncbi:hypothetical protein GWP57_08310 [Gammaproteobacteria bacterium]|jgi:hypothetical protein|nr:hypothetical protein [Gammaproteobacteria bacterium]